MTCDSCGNQIADAAKFCGTCGTGLQGTNHTTAAEANHSGIAAFGKSIQKVLATTVTGARTAEEKCVVYGSLVGLGSFFLLPWAHAYDAGYMSGLGMSHYSGLMLLYPVIMAGSFLLSWYVQKQAPPHKVLTSRWLVCFGALWIMSLLISMNTIGASLRIGMPVAFLAAAAVLVGGFLQARRASNKTVATDGHHVVPGFEANQKKLISMLRGEKLVAYGSLVGLFSFCLLPWTYADFGGSESGLQMSYHSGLMILYGLTMAASFVLSRLIRKQAPLQRVLTATSFICFGAAWIMPLLVSMNLEAPSSIRFGMPIGALASLAVLIGGFLQTRKAIKQIGHWAF
jgi:hypothetical protein